MLGIPRRGETDSNPQYDTEVNTASLGRQS